jgi:hypothetical protein
MMVFSTAPYGGMWISFRLTSLLTRCGTPSSRDVSFPMDGFVRHLGPHLRGQISSFCAKEGFGRENGGFRTTGYFGVYRHR